MQARTMKQYCKHCPESPGRTLFSDQKSDTQTSVINIPLVETDSWITYLATKFFLSLKTFNVKLQTEKKIAQKVTEIDVCKNVHLKMTQPQKVAVFFNKYISKEYGHVSERHFFSQHHDKCWYH